MISFYTFNLNLCNYNKLLIYMYLWWTYEVHIPILMGGWYHYERPNIRILLTSTKELHTWVNSFIISSNGQQLDAVRNIGLKSPYCISNDFWVSTKLYFSVYIFFTFHMEVKVEVRMIDKKFLNFMWYF